MRTKPSIIHMKRIVFSMGLILLMNWASSHPVGPEKAQQLAETFWQQSGCAIRSGISANALTDITAQTEFSHLYIFSRDLQLECHAQQLQRCQQCCDHPAIPLRRGHRDQLHLFQFHRLCSPFCGAPLQCGIGIEKLFRIQQPCARRASF